MEDIHDTFGRKITKYTVIYGGYTQYFWEENNEIYTVHINAIFLAGEK